jgi:2-keto-3-deoxy-L-rhamnonate aldolase RhmA
MPAPIGANLAKQKLAGIDVLHIGATDLSTEMGIPNDYKHERMREAFETVARAAKAHHKSMGVGGGCATTSSFSPGC